MTDHYDVGAALVLGAMVVAPAGLLRLRQVKLRHGLALWLLGWCVGIASLFGRRQR